MSRAKQLSQLPRASLDDLLAATPSKTSQHAFAATVHQQAVADLLQQLPADYNPQHRARVRSCGGPYAGAWLGAIPQDRHTKVLPSTFQRCLQLRLGLPLRELASGAVHCGCGVLVDPYGFHYGAGCRQGNRGNAWGARHEVINDAVISVCRCLGQRGAHAVHQNYLGEAAVSGLGPDGQVTFKRPDGRLRSFHSIDRHVYWDTSVSDPTSQTSLRAGSADASGVAASLRHKQKCAKYTAMVEAAGSQFLAAVIERWGAFGGHLQALVKMVAGDGDLDALGEEGWSFSASSRVTFATQRIGLATAVADAMMVEALVARDVLRAAPPAPAGRRGLGWVGSGARFAECSES